MKCLYPISFGLPSGGMLPLYLGQHPFQYYYIVHRFRVMLLCLLCVSLLISYRDRYWRESTFKGVELMMRTLDEVYGEGKVSLVSAVFRWMNHHSKMRDGG